MADERKPKVSGVYIARSALDEINAYAEIASEESRSCMGKSTECYGYLTTPKARRERIATSSFFPYNQDVSSAHVEIPEGSVISASEEIRKMGYRVLGFWHSHGDMNPFHSETDNENLLSILNRISGTSGSNCITSYLESDLLPKKIVTEIFGNKITIKDAENQFGRSLDIGLSQESPVKSLDVLYAKIRIPYKVGFAYSVVVNAHGSDPFAKIGTRDWIPVFYEGYEKHSMEIVDQLFRTELHVVEADNRPVDKEKIREDVLKKLKFLQEEQKGDGDKGDSNEQQLQ